MLTKDHVQCRLRKERLNVHWLSPIDGDAMVLANQLIRFHQESVGHRYEELLARCKELDAKGNLGEAFLNVLEQRLLFLSHEDDTNARWLWWEKAQELRQRRECDSLDYYHRALSNTVGVAADEIAARLYADVPEQRVIRRFESVHGEGLLRDFNYQQLVFFLSEATELELRFPRGNEHKFFEAAARSSLAPLYRGDGKKNWRGIFPGSKAFAGKNAKGLQAALQHLLVTLLQLSDWQLDLTVHWKGKPTQLSLTIDTLKTLNVPKPLNSQPLWSAPLKAGHLVSHSEECYFYADFLLSQTEEGSWGKIFYPWQSSLLDECLNKQVFTSKSLLLLEHGLKSSYKKKLESLATRVLWFEQTPNEQAIIAYLDALSTQV